ncbi:MAG: flagellar biosynthetic protein FliO [Spirochaetales bacterium]|nr:flagellar biosynthetic protein FliO [Spirochaetales bacterium]
MKKIILILLILSVSAIFSAYSQDEGEAAAETTSVETTTVVPDFNDETTIILDNNVVREPAAGSGNFFSAGDIIKVILILVAVILVIYAIFYGLKKAGGGKFHDDEIIRLVGSRSLSQNGAVHLIEVGAKYYLIGSADGSVTHLADVDDKESVDEIMLKRPTVGQGPKSFSDIFSSMFGRNEHKQGDLSGKIANNNKLVKDQIERLKKM